MRTCNQKYEEKHKSRKVENHSERESKLSTMIIVVKAEVLKNMEGAIMIGATKKTEQIPSVHQSNCSSWITWIMCVYVTRF